MTSKIIARWGFGMWIALGAWLAACSSGGSSSGGGGGAACASNADCGASQACLTTPAGSSCVPVCTGHADACGASAQCGNVAGLSVNVCEPPTPAPSASSPGKPADQPRVTCRTDADCDKLQPGAVCATWNGVKDCSVVCKDDSPCNPPSTGGVTIRFNHCAPDQGATARNVCLPDPKCIANPASCVTLPIPTDDAGVSPDVGVDPLDTGADPIETGP